MMKVRRELILQDLRDGLTLNEVMEKYGVSKSTVYAAQGTIVKEGTTVVLKEAGRVKFSTFAILAELFKPDLTLAEIGRKHGCTRQCVWKIYSQAIDAGMPVPHRNC